MSQDLALKLAAKYADFTGPENFLEYSREEKHLTQDRIETKCVSYGLHTSSWEYMWEALDETLNELAQLSISTNHNKEQIFRLDDNWVWFNTAMWPFKFRDTWEGTDWALGSDVLVSAILCNLQCNPIRVARFIKSLKQIAEWLIKQGTPPDLMFPYEKNMKKAYESVAHPVMMRKLAE